MICTVTSGNGPPTASLTMPKRTSMTRIAKSVSFVEAPGIQGPMSSCFGVAHLTAPPGQRGILVLDWFCNNRTLVTQACRKTNNKHKGTTDANIYMSSEANDITVLFEDGQLHRELDGNRSQLFPLSGTEFYMMGPDVRYRFIDNGTDAHPSIHIRSGNIEFVAQRRLEG
jgi:hypothetical protein